MSLGYLFVILGFGLGIYYIMKHIPNQKECKQGHEVKFNHFLMKLLEVIQLNGLDSVFKLLFWNIFEPGTVEKFGCRTDPPYPRYVAMTLFALYLVLTVIILLNTLIAIMNNSVNSISQREVMSITLF